MKQIELAPGRQVTVYFKGDPLSPGAIPLVLLHGFCEDASLWHALVVPLKNIPIITIDLPGFGQSSLPVEPDMASYAQAVMAALDALAVQQCVLVGHSLGGYVGLELLEQWGDRFAGIGLFHSHPLADTAARQSARLRGVEMVQSGKRDLYVSQLFPNLFAPAFSQAQPAVVEAIISNGKKQPAAGIAAALLAMKSRKDHQATLQNAPCPVLFLQGELDGLIPLEEIWSAAMLPNIACIEILKGVGHMGMLESPASCTKVVQSFYDLSIHLIPLLKAAP